MMFGGDDGLAWTPSPSVLSIKARMLKQTKQHEEKVQPASSDLEPLMNLYKLHNGDLEQIFNDLGDHPGKALKYPPSNAEEFAQKYIGGYYTYVDMKKISAKISMKRAALITEGNLISFLTSEPVAKSRPDDEDAKAARKAQENEANQSMTSSLEKLYNDKNGDVEAIFAVLGEDPGKALKYPPADAATFASKYLDGGYTYVEVRKQPSKPKLAAAVGIDPMVKGFEDLYTQHKGDIKAIFEVLGENPGKALKYPPADASTFAKKYIAGGYTYAASTSNSKAASEEAPASPTPSGDPMIAALEQLYTKHGGDLAAIFQVLGEDPKKALKYPPKDASTFANKYLSGAYTYYTAPEESEASVAARMDAEDEALTPMEVLLMLFPDVEVSLLEAAFQEANGHLEQTVELLLTAMFFSSLEMNQAHMDANTELDANFLAVHTNPDTPPPPPGGDGNGMQGGVSELSKIEMGDKNGDDMMDQVLALTVPPGAVAGDLVRFVTPAGAIVAEVPEGVEEGQPFFVRLQPLV
mmetsp:Transcript_25369/g.30064  ORF Transcript_25369/g.30064 Transcript_25369/m.30064 type:complete len:524 (-) Transcript_25369:201-1772(-)